MASCGLDSGFISWMYEFCINHKPNKLDCFFYTVFFDLRLVEQYKNYSESKARPPPVKILKCPVCGFEHKAADLSCPQCHLSKDYIRDSEAVERRKWLYAMPADVRKAYEKELEELMEYEIPIRKQKMDAMEQKYRLG